jgi:DNA-binding transcriptional regulator YiaG
LMRDYMEAQEVKDRVASTGLTQEEFAKLIDTRFRTFQYWCAHGIANTHSAYKVRECSPDYKEGK